MQPRIKIQSSQLREGTLISLDFFSFLPLPLYLLSSDISSYNAPEV